MNAIEIAGHVVDGLNAAGIQFMLVGSFSTNFWGIPRSTKAADFVLQLAPSETGQLWTIFSGPFAIEPQISFEPNTGSKKLEMRHSTSAFLVELFFLSDDPHHQERFQRRVPQQLQGRAVWYPTPEDVIIQKLRWARAKDLEDARDVLSVQMESIDWPYLNKWCDIHRTRGRLENLRKTFSAP